MQRLSTNLDLKSKMPNLRIETNVPKGNIKDLPAFLKELSSALAATTGKPEQYMVVQVTS